VDEERRTSILNWKRLRNPIDEVQKIKQGFIKLNQYHYLEILETGCLYTSI
jgi:hypothetical protein